MDESADKETLKIVTKGDLTVPGRETWMVVTHRDWNSLRKCIGRIRPQRESVWFAVAGIAFGAAVSLVALVVGLESTNGVDGGWRIASWVAACVAITVFILCVIGHRQGSDLRHKGIEDAIERMEEIQERGGS